MKNGNIAIFASGTGSNALNLIQSYANHSVLNVAVVICNNPNAKVIELAKKEGISVCLITNEEAKNGDFLLKKMNQFSISWIVLAGYLRKIPSLLIQKFEERIINLHPSLLPKFGGKGMYGVNVHKAVLEAQEKETGITIHFVNEKFDEGRIIAQFRCKIDINDELLDIQHKISKLEQNFLPIVVEKTILS